MNQNMTATTDARRFGYYIAKPDERFDFAVHRQTVSADVLIELHEISLVIDSLQPTIIAFDMVERNYRDILDSIEGYRSHLNTNAERLPIDVNGVVLVTQRVSNFLSSASAFLTQTEAQLESVHGQESPESNMWNEKRNDMHAASFSYRFLYELRNFSQHRGLPLSSLNIDGERASENAPMLFKIRTMILRDGLLGTGYKWRKLQVEIQQQPPEFELLPLITEYFHILHHLCLEVLQFQSARLAECASYFNALRRTLNIPVGAVPVIFIGESSSREIPPSRFEVLPIGQFEYILRAYDNLLNVCVPVSE